MGIRIRVPVRARHCPKAYQRQACALQTSECLVRRDLLALHVPKIYIPSQKNILLDDREISKIYWPVICTCVSRKVLKRI